jgi:isopenicillin N synthase-like dioxygenase
VTHDIPRIDIGALFGQDLAARAAVDQAILTAARSEGMLVITGLPHWAVLSPDQRRLLLSLFALPEADIRKLWRWNFDPGNKNHEKAFWLAWPTLASHRSANNFGNIIAILAVRESAVDERHPSQLGSVVVRV